MKAHILTGCDVTSKTEAKTAAIKASPENYLHNFGEQNNLSAAKSFDELRYLFMSAQPVLGYFLAYFYGFSSKLPEMANFSLKIIIFCHFEYFFIFLVQNSVQGATFNFRPILADFRECTLNMTSYHVTEALGGYF